MSKSYVPVPTALATDAEMSNRAVRIYTILGKYADYRTRLAWPTHRTVARDLGCSIPTIERGVRELRESGWITVQQRYSRGPNLYRLNEEPVTEADARSEHLAELERADQVIGIDDDLDEPEAENDGRGVLGAAAETDVRVLAHPISCAAPIPSRLMLHSDVYTKNETHLPPRGAVRPEEGVEKGFDPLEACGLFDTGPCRAPVKEPGARDLAYELRSAWQRERPAALPGDINVAACAGQISAMRRGGVTTTELRSMINLFVQVKGFQITGAAPWKSFLARRHALLLKVRTAAEAIAAENDPEYWTPKPVDSDEENRRWLEEQMGQVAA